MRRVGHVERRLGEGQGHQEGMRPFIATAEVERHKSWRWLELPSSYVKYSDVYGDSMVIYGGLW